MSVLICGGAGYIGSHCVEKLIELNKDVIILDNLSTGNLEAIHHKAKFYYGSLSDSNVLISIFLENKIDVVIHFAASSIVSESMENMFLYYENNVSSIINLLSVMNKFNIKNIIFSSTAAVYGYPKNNIIKEFDNVNPINIYGETKYNIEKIIDWSSKLNNFNYIILRYFNVAGASSSLQIGESHKKETHLIPTLISSIIEEKEFFIFGNEYDTFDGTCIRDYIHIEDLINAHILCLNKITSETCNTVYNLGTESGYSVKQIINETEKLLQKKAIKIFSCKRQGDPDILIASNKKAKLELGWDIKKNLFDILQSAILWQLNKKF
jgi:UDP-glucose 4-epimerase